jgi:hypothetical protein
VDKVDTARIDEAKAAFEKPVQWSQKRHDGLLFTSVRYYLENGALQQVAHGAKYKHGRTGDPIPNDWFTANNLSLPDPNVPFEDPDGDGFSNEDEWLFKTDPNSKESHPPYYTQLFLKAWIKVPFRLKFQTYDGDPKGPKDKLTVQINTLDLRQPSEFLKIGDTVSNTKFKIKDFQFKEVLNPKTQEMDDVSELTVVNVETGEEVVLIKEKVVDSPNQFADFEYRWNKKHGEPGQIIRVPKLKEFVLPPEGLKAKYKLLDVNQQNAVIQLPDGQKYTVELLTK